MFKQDKLENIYEFGTMIKNVTIRICELVRCVYFSIFPDTMVITRLKTNLLNIHTTLLESPIMQ
jgi:hypothetical protein